MRHINQADSRIEHVDDDVATYWPKDQTSVALCLFLF